VKARETPIGFLPHAADIDINDLEISDENLNALLSVDIDQWKLEMDTFGEYLQSYGDRLPAELKSEHASIVAALQKAS